MKKIIIISILLVIGITIYGIEKVQEFNKLQCFDKYVLIQSKEFNNYILNNNEITTYNNLIKESKNIIKNKTVKSINEVEKNLQRLNKNVVAKDNVIINKELNAIKNLKIDSKNEKKVITIDNLVTQKKYKLANIKINELNKNLYIENSKLYNNQSYDKLVQANDLIDSYKLKAAQDIMNSISYTKLNKINVNEYNYLRIIMDEKFIDEGKVITH